MQPLELRYLKQMMDEHIETQISIKTRKSAFLKSAKLSYMGSGNVT